MEGRSEVELQPIKSDQYQKVSSTLADTAEHSNDSDEIDAEISGLEEQDDPDTDEDQKRGENGYEKIDFAPTRSKKSLRRSHKDRGLGSNLVLKKDAEETKTNDTVNDGFCQGQREEGDGTEGIFNTDENYNSQDEEAVNTAKQ